MLVAALYNLGKTEEIKAFIGDKKTMRICLEWYFGSMHQWN